MRSASDFQETQKLMDEYKSYNDKVPELENKIEINNKKSAMKIERLEEQLNLTYSDAEFEIDRESLQEEINNQIEREKESLEEENSQIEEEIKENKENSKYFRTDANLKTITMEIKEMQKEVQNCKLELSKKEVELQEFYAEGEEHDDPLKWQKIYKEKDELNKNISELTAKIEEYSKFKEELLSIELTADEYKKMFAREEKKQNKEVNKDSKEKNEEEIQKEEELAWKEHDEKEKTNERTENEAEKETTETGAEKETTEKRFNEENIEKEPEPSKARKTINSNLHEKVDTPEVTVKETTEKLFNGENIEKEPESAKVRKAIDLNLHNNTLTKEVIENNNKTQKNINKSENVKQQEEIVKKKEEEPILDINFNAKEQKYEITTINSDKKESKTMTIEEIQNDRSFRDFNFEFDKENNNADIYVAYLLDKMDKTLGTTRYENYVKSTNEKEKISDKTHINYFMDGIYGKQYSLQLSEEMMRIANYHSDNQLATVEKNKWTKTLEKSRFLRKSIDALRKARKNLAFKKEYKTLELPALSEDEKALKEFSIKQEEIRVKQEKFNEYKKEKESKMQENGQEIRHASANFRKAMRANDETIEKIQKKREEKMIAINKEKENKQLEGEGIKFEDFSNVKDNNDERC